MKVMKKLVLFFAAVSVFCACSVDIEWEYAGWSETMNETSEPVTLVTTFHPMVPPETVIILPGESVKQYKTLTSRGTSVGESLTATIILADKTEIFCSKDSADDWSRRFYGNFETRKSAQWSHFRRHEITIDTYHIDNELIEIWRKNQSPGK